MTQPNGNREAGRMEARVDAIYDIVSETKKGIACLYAALNGEGDQPGIRGQVVALRVELDDAKKEIDKLRARDWWTGGLAGVMAALAALIGSSR